MCNPEIDWFTFALRCTLFGVLCVTVISCVVRLHTLRLDAARPLSCLALFPYTHQCTLLSISRVTVAPYGADLALTCLDSAFLKVKDVTKASVPCTALSMAFFDRLYEHDVLRANGAIKGCAPEYVDSMEINSQLTKVGKEGKGHGRTRLAGYRELFFLSSFWRDFWMCIFICRFETRGEEQTQRKMAREKEREKNDKDR